MTPRRDPVECCEHSDDIHDASGCQSYSSDMPMDSVRCPCRVPKPASDSVERLREQVVLGGDGGTALEAARKVYADSMWSSPEVTVCSCSCHGPSEANVEHHVEAIAAFGASEFERGRVVGQHEIAYHHDLHAPGAMSDCERCRALRSGADQKERP